jgi:SEC-C motif-containing protein
MMELQHCFCGSGLLFTDCCSPLLSGQRSATTAEQLMRSRYSANVVDNERYLLASWHPSTRPVSLDMASGPQWVGLTVVDVKNGRREDLSGKVEFKATYIQDGTTAVLHERSTFVQENGKWYYVDGIAPAQGGRTAQKVGRNALCPCGSGQKYKKCCMRSR